MSTVGTQQNETKFEMKTKHNYSPIYAYNTLHCNNYQTFSDAVLRFVDNLSKIIMTIGIYKNATEFLY